MRKLFASLTGLLMAAVVVQFFLAGMGAFDSAPLDESFRPHRTLGYLIVLIALLAVLAAALAKVPGRLVGRTALVLGLTLLQPVIAGVAHAVGGSGGSTTTAGQLVFGLHAVNAVVIMALLASALRLGREPRMSRTATRSQPSTHGAPARSVPAPGDPAR